jgi:prophage antirepressor-like protein
MTNLMKFEDVELAVIDRGGQPWFTAGDVASALGYDDQRHVNRLYARNADEFTDSMSTIVKLPTAYGEMRGQIDPASVGNRLLDVRVFSLRGAHLVAMLARTPRARAFRAWALDLIEAELAQLRDPGRGRDAVTARIARALYLDKPDLRSDSERFSMRDPGAAAAALRQLSAQLASAEASRDAILRRMALDEGDGPRIDLRTAAAFNLARLAVEQAAIEDLTTRLRAVAAHVAPVSAPAALPEA